MKAALRAFGIWATSMVALSCSAGTPAPAQDPNPDSQGLSRIHARVRVDGLEDRRFGPDSYWRVMDRAVARASSVGSEVVGQSAEGRDLRLLTFGRGDTSVLLAEAHDEKETP